jgi:hypothetical protein
MLQYKDQKMNEHPRKVSSLETFYNHIAVQNRTLHARWNNCVRRKAARRRFDTYIAKVKVMDNFWQLVANQDVKAVVYGSADFDATGKSEHAVPVGGVSTLHEGHPYARAQHKGEPCEVLEPCGEM